MCMSVCLSVWRERGQIPLNQTSFSCRRPCDSSEISITSNSKMHTEIEHGWGGGWEGTEEQPLLTQAFLSEEQPLLTQASLQQSTSSIKHKSG